MKKYILVTLTLGSMLFYGCGKNDLVNDENGNRVKQMIISSIDFVNSDTVTTKSQFDYSYKDNGLIEIIESGLKRITFENKNDKVVEKIYFNSLEQKSSIDSFFYDADGKLELIKRVNISGWHIQSIKFSYNSDQLSKVVNSTFYPKTIIEEYEFVYKGSNIETVNATSGNLKLTYRFQYFEDDNMQDLNFYLQVFGVYTSGIYAVNVTTIPIIYSKNRIKSVSGFDALGAQTFEYNFEHSISNDQYNTLNFKWHDQNQALLNTTNILFNY